MKTIGMLGKKLPMTQLPSSTGELKPATPIWIGGNMVSQVKTKEKDGYEACQLAFWQCRSKILTKPQLGHLNKNDLSSYKYLREVRDMVGFVVGTELNVLSIFKEGDETKITATTHGKGTAGVVKRHGFSLLRSSHGTGPVRRSGGSLAGGRGTRQKVSKNKKMAGRMGNKKITQKSIIEKIDAENQIIFLRGAIPGPKRGLIILRKSV